MKRFLSTLALFAASVNSWGATLVPIQLLNPTGSTSGQAIVSTGPSTAPAWTGVALTSGTLAQFASTTSAQLAGIISNETGSGSLVFGTSPVITGASISGGGGINGVPIGGTTPGTGAFTTLSTTGLITPASAVGIKGTVLADNAQAGSIGEEIEATGTAVALTSGTTTNVTSIALTAGDWDVQGYVEIDTAATTIFQNAKIGVSSVSATMPGAPNFSWRTGLTYGANATYTDVAPIFRINVNTGATMYLVVTPAFITSTATATGKIRARRVR